MAEAVAFARVIAGMDFLMKRIADPVSVEITSRADVKLDQEKLIVSLKIMIPIPPRMVQRFYPFLGLFCSPCCRQDRHIPDLNMRKRQ